MELQTLRAKHAGKNYYSALTAGRNEINAIHALARFDEGDFQAAWAFLDLTPKSSCELTLDPKLALQRSDQMLLQALLLLNEGKVGKVPLELHKLRQSWMKYHLHRLLMGYQMQGHMPPNYTASLLLKKARS